MPFTPKPTILQAIFALHDNIGGGMPELFLDEVEQGTDYPRAICSFGGEAPFPDEGAYDEGAELPSLSQAEFSLEYVTENDSDETETLALAAMRAFLPRALLLDYVSDQNKIFLFRTGYVVRNAGQRSKNNKPTYSATISYRVRFPTNY